MAVAAREKYVVVADVTVTVSVVVVDVAVYLSPPTNVQQDTKPSIWMVNVRPECCESVSMPW